MIGAHGDRIAYSQSLTLRAARVVKIASLSISPGLTYHALSLRSNLVRRKLQYTTSKSSKLSLTVPISVMMVRVLELEAFEPSGKIFDDFLDFIPESDSASLTRVGISSTLLRDSHVPCMLQSGNR